MRRRRECGSCGHRFTTFERLAPMLAIVRKRDGRREEFDAAKLRAGLERSAHKLPAAEAAVDSIAEVVELEAATGGELSTRRIGELCLDGLRDADRIAYVRFASVHKQLADTEALKAELSALDLELDGWDADARGAAAIVAADAATPAAWDSEPANGANFKTEKDKDETGHAPDLNETETGRQIHA